MNIHVAGIGAVSPAGWSLADAATAVRENTLIAPQVLQREGWEKPLRLRMVPPPKDRPSFFTHPRLRRASPLSQYAASACLEATRGLLDTLKTRRLGLVSCLQSGPVQYACRFYEEVLKDPSTASPVLFPETVFSAPASHIGALFGEVPMATTLLGDPGTFFQGLAHGAAWIEEGSVDFALVFGAEEFNWVHANAVWHLDSRSTLGAGAGAMLLCGDPQFSIGVELHSITDPHTYSCGCSPARAAERMRGQLPPGSREELLCDSRGGARRLDLAEAQAWRDWPGARLSPKHVLGEGLMAGAAWQAVLAAHCLREGGFNAANVSVTGVNQQAIGGRFCATKKARPSTRL